MQFMAAAFRFTFALWSLCAAATATNKIHFFFRLENSISSLGACHEPEHMMMIGRYWNLLIFFCSCFSFCVYAKCHFDITLSERAHTHTPSEYRVPVWRILINYLLFVSLNTTCLLVAAFGRHRRQTKRRDASFKRIMSRRSRSISSSSDPHVYAFITLS